MRDGHFGFGCGPDDGAVMACNVMGERMSLPYICLFVVTLDVVLAVFVVLVLSLFSGKNCFHGKLFCLMYAVFWENVVSLYLQTHAGPASSMGDATRVDRMGRRSGYREGALHFGNASLTLCFWPF